MSFLLLFQRVIPYINNWKSFIGVAPGYGLARTDAFASPTSSLPAWKVLFPNVSYSAPIEPTTRHIPDLGLGNERGIGHGSIRTRSTCTILHIRSSRAKEWQCKASILGALPHETIRPSHSLILCLTSKTSLRVSLTTRSCMKRLRDRA